MDKYLGKRLDGRYEIHELIGVGGMANVYRCTDTLDDREVAIKILKDEYLNNEEFIRRFKNESKAIAMLSHPNIVKVYDVSFGDMIQYIVMEYIDGITLKEYIDRQGVIEWKDALHLTTQVLRALQHAHESGIVHRDIKPQNIMLLQDGTIKVTDFGIARFSDKTTRTMTDQAIGSVHYIAPEQARGDVTDGKTDIYSVGVMLYEMLTGKLPFEGDSAVSVALMQLQSTPKRPREVNPSIPVGLEQITLRAMEKQPEKRYAAAAEMLSDIDRFRLNPSIVFDYGTAFTDSQPTKYVEKEDRRQEPQRYAEERKPIKKPVKKQPEPVPAAEEDDEIREHGTFFHVAKGVLIATLAVALIFVVLGILQGYFSTRSRDVNVPDYVGKIFAEVDKENAASETPFRFTVKSRYDESQSLGAVLSQEPAGNMKVKAGSEIILYVNNDSDEITVPFVKQKTKEEAERDINEHSLAAELVYVENSKLAKDSIITTFPAAGAKTTIGSKVYVFISNGSRPETVEIPSILGETLDEARAKLDEMGFTVDVVYDEESKLKRDTVISSSPLPHGTVEKGTPVTLTVSAGKGDRSKVKVNVELPAGITDTLRMSVFVDGNEDTAKSRDIVPAYAAMVELDFEGTGTQTVEIYLNGQLYVRYTLDYSLGAITNVEQHDYVAPTEAPTEPETEPQTEYVPETEPETEPSYEGGEGNNTYNEYGY